MGYGCFGCVSYGLASLFLRRQANATRPTAPSDSMITDEGSGTTEMASWSTLFAAKPNVLFIAIDDLRPELGCYGVKEIKTPGIDALAASGVTFHRAYCQLAVCNPSRVSLLTGLRPDSTKVWDLATRFRHTVPDAVTLPQHFKSTATMQCRLARFFITPGPTTSHGVSHMLGQKRVGCGQRMRGNSWPLSRRRCERMESPRSRSTACAPQRQRSNVCTPLLPSSPFPQCQRQCQL